MDKIEFALKLAKDCTYADAMTEGAKEVLRNKIDEAINELKNNRVAVKMSELVCPRCGKGGFIVEEKIQWCAECNYMQGEAN